MNTSPRGGRLQQQDNRECGAGRSSESKRVLGYGNWAITIQLLGSCCRFTFARGCVTPMWPGREGAQTSLRYLRCFVAVVCQGVTPTLKPNKRLRRSNFLLEKGEANG